MTNLKILSLTKPETQKRAIKIDGFHVDHEGKPQWTPIANEVYDFISKIPYKELGNKIIEDIQMDETEQFIAFIKFTQTENGSFKSEKKTNDLQKPVEKTDWREEYEWTRQSQIRKESCINSAIEFCNLIGKRDVTSEDIVKIAKKFEGYVIDKSIPI